MRIMLCTLCLNEMEWLPLLYEQHKDWPEMAHWCFVESADITYRKTNPDRVSADRLSVDGTSEFLTNLEAKDRRISYVPFGECGASDPAQAKCEARQAYLDIAEHIEPDLLIVIDADEFYTHEDQRRVTSIVQQTKSFNFQCWLFSQRHIWYPPSVHGGPIPRLAREVTGGYWKIPHCRVWKWQPGLRYNSNHNWPEDRYSRYLTRAMFRTDKIANRRLRPIANNSPLPQCVHMGFASSLVSRQAKHNYYVARGEGVRDRRQMYVDCRLAYEHWTEGKPLPHGAEVKPYTGPIPEVFQHECVSRHNELLPTTERPRNHQGLA